MVRGPAALATLLPLEGAGETDDAPDEAVVMRVSRRAEALLQAGVEVVFAGSREGPIRDLNSQALESRRGDQNEQRAIRHLILGQVGQPLLDQFLSRE